MASTSSQQLFGEDSSDDEDAVTFAEPRPRTAAPCAAAPLAVAAPLPAPEPRPEPRVSPHAVAAAAPPQSVAAMARPRPLAGVPAAGALKLCSMFPCDKPKCIEKLERIVRVTLRCLGPHVIQRRV